MVNETDFSIDKNVLSNREQTTKGKNIDRGRLAGYVKKIQEEARIAVETGNVKSLEEIVDEPLFSEDFNDQRGFFEKIKDTTKYYLAVIKQSEYNIKSGKYQAVESQIKELESKKQAIDSYRKDYLNVKTELLRLTSSYSLELDEMVSEIADLNSQKKDLMKTFSEDVIGLLSDYFEGNLTKSELKKEGLSTDIKSLQSYRHGLMSLERLNSEIDRRKSALENLNIEYEITMDKKLGIELDIIDLDMQDFYTKSLINQLSVDLKLVDKPSFSSLSAKLRFLRDGAYKLVENLLDDDIRTRESYNRSVKVAGSDSSFRKKYLSRQKKRPGLDI